MPWNSGAGAASFGVSRGAAWLSATHAVEARQAERTAVKGLRMVQGSCGDGFLRRAGSGGYVAVLCRRGALSQARVWRARLDTRCYTRAPVLRRRALDDADIALGRAHQVHERGLVGG